ncbi:hypothetical protein BKA82DRAFT_1009307 [Pisolithus tinctorius]|uniref:Uncharacterized protein n=1 Tax=Pisolithus tinctorius Marx 270 TaxID=870435 RepID=A0A0C3J5C7_PISTI|nr:hypothetical protein BKA82DRAFT_1009307 [Pisolithus tinctorius]KIN92886.1 hypothetical protein M404DRAFT_1009307 [Pisolithus tinctorius Marx 270]
MVPSASDPAVKQEVIHALQDLEGVVRVDELVALLHIHASIPRLSRTCLIVGVSRILRPYRTAHCPSS